MKASKATVSRAALVLFAVAAFVAGCNNGSGTMPGATVTSNQAYRVHRLASASTTVKVFNEETASIVGTTPVNTCWTVSPSPLPTASADGHTPIITETYNTTCVANLTTVTLQYTVDNVTCNFTSTYEPGGTFTYTAFGSDGNCSATPAPSGSNYDEKFTYGLILGGASKTYIRKGH